MSFERADIYSTSVLPGEANGDDQYSEVIKAFKKFILEFRIDNQFIYRDQLRENILVRQYQLTVQNGHLIAYHDELNKKLMDNPTEMVALFEQAITEIAKRIIYISNEEVPSNFPTCQLILLTQDSRISIRSLNAGNISKIVKISVLVHHNFQNIVWPQINQMEKKSNVRQIHISLFTTNHNLLINKF
ncbi:unnamed protein product [[Candida] boidinii]|nr:unnamed protein product [[Candida] boidinii]